MHLKVKLKIYIYSLLAFSAVHSIISFNSDSISALWLLPILILTVAADFFKINIRIYGSREHVSISWSSVMTIGALLSLGISEAILVNILSALVCSLYPRRLHIHKLLYNVSSFIVTVILTSYVGKFMMMAFPQIDFIVYGIVVSFMYVIINYSLVIYFVRILTGKSYRSIFIDLVGPHIPHSMMFAFVGGGLGIYYKEYGVVALAFVAIFTALIIKSMKLSIHIANRRIKELEGCNTKAIQLAAELERNFQEFIQTLTTTIDARDPYTYGHSIQVSNYAYHLAIEMGLAEEEAEKVRIAGLLHDIGKLSIPETIIFKPDRLTNEEYGVIKQHAFIGEEIVAEVSSLRDVATLVGMHHERYDGKGYPKGFEAERIPIGAYILGVADALDTILSDRSYKKGKTIEEALEEFGNCKGTQFHPEVVDALFRLYEKYGGDMFVNSAQLVDKDFLERIVKRVEKV